MVLGVSLEVRLELIDASGKQGNLSLCRTGVSSITTKLCDDFLFLFFRDHKTLLLAMLRHFVRTASISHIPPTALISSSDSAKIARTLHV